MTAQIDGLAASAATFIVCAASSVSMAQNALFMIHDPAVGGGGSAADLRKLAGVLDKIGDTMVNVYAAKTGKPSADIRAKMAAETWFSAEEAKTFGFVDKITDAITTTAHFDLSTFTRPPAAAARFGDFQAAAGLEARLTAALAERDTFKAAIEADGLFEMVTDHKGKTSLTLTDLGEARFVNAQAARTLAASGHMPLPILESPGPGGQNFSRSGGQPGRGRTKITWALPKSDTP